MRSQLEATGNDYIDLYFMHGFDALTPVEEMLSELDDLIRAGKIRRGGCSNFSSWNIMKSLATSERYGLGANRSIPTDTSDFFSECNPKATVIFIVREDLNGTKAP